MQTRKSNIAKLTFVLFLSTAVLFLLMLPCLPGCSKKAEMAEPEMLSRTTALDEQPGRPAASAAGEFKMAADTTAAQTGAEGNAEAPPDVTNLALRGRKLIREGAVKLKVKDVDEARGKLEALINAAGGFIANVNYQRYTATRQIELTLRLPAEGFTAFIEKIRTLGHMEEESVNVQDVTDQYVDLQRRIDTKEKLAERLEKLIQERSYQFRDLLEVERELSRLRLEIEQLQGSLRGLDDRISLSTLNVTMYQDVLQRVVPPDSVFAPLLNAIENAGPNFGASLRAMMSLFGGVIRLAMLLLPWLIFGLVVTLIVVGIVKAAQRRKKK